MPYIFIYPLSLLSTSHCPFSPSVRPSLLPSFPALPSSLPCSPPPSPSSRPTECLPFRRSGYVPVAVSQVQSHPVNGQNSTVSQTLPPVTAIHLICSYLSVCMPGEPRLTTGVGWSMPRSRSPGGNHTIVITCTQTVGSSMSRSRHVIGWHGYSPLTSLHLLWIHKGLITGLFSECE